MPCQCSDVLSHYVASKPMEGFKEISNDPELVLVLGHLGPDYDPRNAALRAKLFCCGWHGNASLAWVKFQLPAR